MWMHALHTMLQHAPHRVVVPVLQFCLSGGFSRFLRLPQYHRYVTLIFVKSNTDRHFGQAFWYEKHFETPRYGPQANPDVSGTHTWPVLQIATSSETESSLADFMPRFMRELQVVLRQQDHTATFESLYAHCKHVCAQHLLGTISVLTKSYNSNTGTSTRACSR
jgi:hypothetical protein